MPGSIYLRRATAADQRPIDALIRTVGINPMGLKWPHFVVADEAGRIVGAGQVKLHGDGARELASIAVAPDRQGMGIGRAIVATFVSLEPTPFYLYCADHNEGYYMQFGFRALVPDEMPGSLRRIYRISTAILPIVAALTGQRRRLVVMGRGLDRA